MTGGYGVFVGQVRVAESGQEEDESPDDPAYPGEDAKNYQDSEDAEGDRAVKAGVKSVEDVAAV